jgi:hypothetical protein
VTRIRSAIATLTLTLTVLFPYTPGTATPTSSSWNPEIRAAVASWRDRRAINELISWYRRWLAALATTSATPYTWPDCPGMRFAIPGEIVWRESRCTNAENPISTASGYYQFVDGTWAGHGGYSHASSAPKAVQDARAAQVWAGGRGACHWAPNRWC